MKQATVATLALLFLCASITSYAQETKMKEETAQGKKMKMKQEKDKMKMKGDMGMQQVDLPYTASYSSQFMMGKPAQAKMVLDLYHDYEANDFSKNDWFADTLMVITSDGHVTKGRDAVIDMIKQGRASMSSSKFEIIAVLPTHSVDRNEDWVAVWGRQMFTTSSDNMQNSVEFNNIWRFNKDGKIDFIEFFEGKTPTQQQ